MLTALGEIVDRERHTVQSAKFMLTVVWNPIGFHVLKTIPKGRKFNAQYYYIILYYTNDFLVAISDWRRQTGQTGQTAGTRPNKLWMHSDNVRSHNPKMARDVKGLHRSQSNETGTSSPIRQI
jgi:hypothetical protein